MKRKLPMAAVFTVALLSSALLVSAGEEEKKPADRPSALEAQMLDLVNKEREQRDLGALKLDRVLTEAARGHSQEMAEKNYFSHRSPTPGRHDPLDRYSRALGKRPRSYSLAENIYKGSHGGITAAHKALMESPGHRTNLLDRSWKRIGVGVHVNEHGYIWVTQMFSD